MEYKVQEFDGTVTPELEQFMSISRERGLVNNATIEDLYRYRRERESVLFLLSNEQGIMGTFGAHSMDIFPDSYRICARACILTDKTERSSLRTRNQILKHDNVLARFGLHYCTQWVLKQNPAAKIFITTHPSEVGAMELMHRIVCPIFERAGLVQNYGDHEYYKHVQRFWLFKPEKYYEQINEQSVL
jgi:hypothetical protein